MSNLLIVESKNDKFFIEALIQYLNLQDIEVSNGLICEINDYECLNGLSSSQLERTLKAVKNYVKKEDTQRIGILLDIDDETIENRLTLVNKALQNTFETSPQLIQQNTFIEIEIDESQNVQIATYFTNVNGQGELETLLKAIKSKDSIHADCLDSWQQCLIANNVRNGQGLKQKDFDKLWIEKYIRYDTCTRKERKQAGTKCNNEAAMSKDIWNFEHEYLNHLKTFLRLFTQNI